MGKWLEADMAALLGSDYLYDVYVDSEYYVVLNSDSGLYMIFNVDPEDCDDLQDSNIVAFDVPGTYVERFFEKLADHSFQAFNPD